jgi:hypothetical protein
VSNTISSEKNEGQWKTDEKKAHFSHNTEEIGWEGGRRFPDQTRYLNFVKIMTDYEERLLSFFSRLSSSFEPSRILFCMICVYSAENIPFHLVCLGKTVLRRIETVMTGFDFMSVCLSFV